MNKDRGAEIRLRQEENRKLEEQTKRMEEELEKVRKLKQMENEKLKLQQQMKELDLNKQEQKKTEQTTTLRGYGAKLAQKNNEKIEKKMKKFAKQFMESSESEEKDYDDDGENIRYFLEVMGMVKYFSTLKQHKILTLEKLKAVKQADLKKLAIPLKDMVTINKKLRTMGIN